MTTRQLTEHQQSLLSEAQSAMDEYHGINRQHQLLEEILDSYGLEPLVNALLVRYSLDAIQDALRGVPAQN